MTDVPDLSLHDLSFFAKMKFSIRAGDPINQIVFLAVDPTTSMPIKQLIYSPQDSSNAVFGVYSVECIPQKMPMCCSK